MRAYLPIIPFGPGPTPVGSGGAASDVQNRTKEQTIKLISANSAATDVGSFVGLPTKYRINKLTIFDASTSLTLATVDLRDAAAGAGNAIVAAQALAALTAANLFLDATLAITSQQSAATLFLRNVTAQGAPATISAVLNYTDLT
jgi:hypothetical protein